MAKATTLKYLVMSYFTQGVCSNKAPMEFDQRYSAQDFKPRGKAYDRIVAREHDKFRDSKDCPFRSGTLEACSNIAKLKRGKWERREAVRLEKKYAKS